MTQSEWEAAVAQMREAGLPTQVTLQAFVSADGTRRYAGIWSTAGDVTQAIPVMEPPKTGGYEVESGPTSVLRLAVRHHTPWTCSASG